MDPLTEQELLRFILDQLEGASSFWRTFFIALVAAVVGIAGSFAAILYQQRKTRLDGVRRQKNSTSELLKLVRDEIQANVDWANEIVALDFPNNAGAPVQAPDLRDDAWRNTQSAFASSQELIGPLFATISEAYAHFRVSNRFASTLVDLVTGVVGTGVDPHPGPMVAANLDSTAHKSVELGTHALADIEAKINGLKT